MMQANIKDSLDINEWRRMVKLTNICIFWLIADFQQHKSFYPLVRIIFRWLFLYVSMYLSKRFRTFVRGKLLIRTSILL